MLYTLYSVTHAQCQASLGILDIPTQLMKLKRHMHDTRRSDTEMLLLAIVIGLFAFFRMASKHLTHHPADNEYIFFPVMHHMLPRDEKVALFFSIS